LDGCLDGFEFTQLAEQLPVRRFETTAFCSPTIFVAHGLSLGQKYIRALHYEKTIESREVAFDR
jgi:hypothetical protein